MQKPIILASKSPRRQELLEQVKIPFILRTADLDESIITTKDPVEKVSQLASLKNKAIPMLKDDELIISADTVVSFKGQIFEKPKDKPTAYDMISQLSGQTHDVYTGVMIRSSKQSISFVEQTKVEFWPLKKADIESYINTDEPYDKAGAYGIQSLAALFVKRIIGDYYNVVGLPISRLLRELKKMST